MENFIYSLPTPTISWGFICHASLFTELRLMLAPDKNLKSKIAKKKFVVGQQKSFFLRDKKNTL